MSKLASFINKPKTNIDNVGITPNCFFVIFRYGLFGEFERMWLTHPNPAHTNSPVLSNFNKKEKTLETKHRILIIKSFDHKTDEEFFWKKIEEISKRRK